MMRWLEEYELKHAELVRCVAGFHSLEQAWHATAKGCADEVYGGYARLQANIYHQLHQQADQIFAKVGSPYFADPNVPLPEALDKFRADELCWFRELVGEDNTSSPFVPAPSHSSSCDQTSSAAE
jgi:hypothetical protein